MKTQQWMSLLAASAVALASTACHEWGQADPPAGNDIYPTLENVVSYAFDDEALDPAVFNLNPSANGQLPALTQDDAKGQVLAMNGGYVEMTNPLSAVTCQSSASLTFWYKQDARLVDGEEAPLDVNGAIFSVENENGTGKLFFTANGWIDYQAPDGEWSDNNPANYTTGYLTVGEWHFIGLIIRTNGYDIWVDGNQKVDKPVENFDCSKLVKFLNKSPKLYIGKGGEDADGAEVASAPFAIDDITFFRNEATAKELSPKGLSGGGGQGGDTNTFEVAEAVGAEDCSQAWWTAWSSYYKIPKNATAKLQLRNHTSGGGNWNNWNLCVCTDADRNADGYAEYLVIRSDLYGWGDYYNGEAWTNEGYGDWDAFRADMEGAIVDITIARQGANIVITAVANCPNGAVYKESITAEGCGDGNQMIRAFLIPDGSYLEIGKNSRVETSPVEVTIPAIGADDCSAAWWTEFSDYFTVPANETLHLDFINHTSGGGNWNNWNLCAATNAVRGGDGYAEYFVIRSDLYGWGDNYAAGTWTNEGYGDWDAFRADMEGAHVNIDVIREGAKITTDAVANCPNGTVYRETFVTDGCGDGNQKINVFLIVDGSHLVLNPDKCFIGSYYYN